jgi:hypothetical protein
MPFQEYTHAGEMTMLKYLKSDRCILQGHDVITLEINFVAGFCVTGRKIAKTFGYWCHKPLLLNDSTPQN